MSYTLILISAIIIVIAVCIFFFFSKKIYCSRKENMLSGYDEFYQQYFDKREGLDEQKTKMVALSAVCSVYRGAYVNSLSTGLKKDAIQDILENSWKITDSKQAVSAINRMKNRGARNYFPVVYESFVKKESSDEVQESLVLDNYNDTIDIDKTFYQIYNLQDSYSYLKLNKIVNRYSDLEKYGVIGWDCSKIVFLSRLCFDVGYITEEEAWNYIRDASDLAHAFFSNWHDYAYSYIIGRAMWGGKRIVNEQMIHIARMLLSSSESIWRKCVW